MLSSLRSLFSLPLGAAVALLVTLIAGRPVDTDAQGRPPEVTIRTLGQQVSTGAGSLSEVVTEVGARVPIRDQFSVQFLGRAAQASGEGFERVRGLDDVQLSASYTRSIGENDLVAGLSAALPTGKQDLTPDQFATASTLSRDRFDFYVSGFGQGVQVAPRLSFIAPLRDDLVVGATMTGRYLGGYTPQSGMPDAYVPGNALRTAVGADLRLTQTSAISGDLAFTTYGTDTMGGQKQLALGNQWSLTAQYLNRFGYNRVRAVARYQGRQQSTVFAARRAGLSDPSDLRVRPRESFVQAGARVRLVPDVYATVRGRGSLFRETARFSGAWVGRLLLRPEWAVTDRWTVAARLSGSFGDVQGLGGGLEASLSF